METQDAFVGESSQDGSESVMQADWTEPAGAEGPGESASSGRESSRMNLAARRAIEDYQERKRLRQLLGDDLLDY